MRILLLEDDPVLNEILEEFLLELQYDITTTFSGEEAISLVFEQKFDLLLLDINVPGISGLELLKELRDKEIYTPTIFITSLNTISDVENGFNAGCDDYIKKPFELKELELRINNIKRLHHLEESVIKITDNITFDPRENLLINSGISTQLPQKEAGILQYLHKNLGQTVSTEELINNLWSYEEHPSSSTIRTYIKNIRKLLGEEFIQTIKGVGYRFNKQ